MLHLFLRIREFCLKDRNLYLKNSYLISRLTGKEVSFSVGFQAAKIKFTWQKEFTNTEQQQQKRASQYTVPFCVGTQLELAPAANQRADYAHVSTHL